MFSFIYKILFLSNNFFIFVIILQIISIIKMKKKTQIEVFFNHTSLYLICGLNAVITLTN